MQESIQLRRPLENLTCPYCGSPIDRSLRTKEHVIGKRFVPRGSLDGNWNLILWGWLPCNQRKSEFEDDIAATTMYFHTAGLQGMSDVAVREEALRKGANSYSRKTKKRISESAEQFTVSGSLGGNAVISASFTSPPQIVEERAFELARLQLTGFFYFLTYKPQSRLGYWWPGGFYPLHGTIKSDWGNSIHRALMAEVQPWDYCLVLTTASGYFRAMIRRHPSAECWAWAIEWNGCYRLVGFFGELAAAQKIAGRMPSLEAHPLAGGSTAAARYHIEQALPENEDTLFSNEPAAET